MRKTWTVGYHGRAVGDRMLGSFATKEAAFEAFERAKSFFGKTAFIAEVTTEEGYCPFCGSKLPGSPVKEGDLSYCNRACAAADAAMLGN